MSLKEEKIQTVIETLGNTYFMWAKMWCENQDNPSKKHQIDFDFLSKIEARARLTYVYKHSIDMRHHIGNCGSWTDSPILRDAIRMYVLDSFDFLVNDSKYRSIFDAWEQSIVDQ